MDKQYYIDQSEALRQMVVEAERRLDSALLDNAELKNQLRESEQAWEREEANQASFLKYVSGLERQNENLAFMFSHSEELDAPRWDRLRREARAWRGVAIFAISALITAYVLICTMP